MLGVSIIVLLVGVVLVIQSIAIGFTFLVLPVVVVELLFLGAVYLLREALLDDEEPGERRPAWYARTETPPPRAQRMRRQVDHLRASPRHPQPGRSGSASTAAIRERDAA